MRVLIATLAVSLLPAGASGEPALTGDGAFLRVLDMITGQFSDIKLGVGETAEFSKISIALEDCRYFPETPLSDSYAFVHVTEQSTQKSLFRAWMIASAPALSAMDHHRYDVWLIRCSTSDPDRGNS